MDIRNKLVSVVKDAVVQTEIDWIMDSFEEDKDGDWETLVYRGALGVCTITKDPLKVVIRKYEDIR